MKKLRDQKIIVMFSDNKQHNDRCESFKKKISNYFKGNQIQLARNPRLVQIYIQKYIESKSLKKDIQCK